MKKSATAVKTQIGTKVGVLVIGLAGLAAAAGFVTAAATDAVVKVDLGSLSPSHTSVRGQDNDNSLNFVLTAKNKDVMITKLVFTGIADDDRSFTTVQNDLHLADFMENCSLMDGATMVATPEPFDANQQITFDNLQLSVTTSSPKSYMVQCDLANIPVHNGNPDIFALQLVGNGSVVAEQTDNGDMIPEQRIHLGGPADPGVNPNGRRAGVTIVDHGDISIAVSSNTPSPDFILTSSLNTEVAAYQFTATREAFNIQTLTVSEEQAEDDTGNNDSTAYTNNISLVTITYPKADGTTGTAMTVMTGNEARYSGLDMYVAPGAAATVKVYVNTPLTDRSSGGAATSNEKIRMGLFVDKANNDNFKAVGESSGAYLNDQSQNAIGNDKFSVDGVATFVVRETKPTITLSASSFSGPGIVGRSEVLKFNVAASANEDLVLKTLLFKMNSTDNAGSKWNECDTDTAGFTTPADFDLYNLTDDGTSVTLDLDSDIDENDSLAEAAASTDSPWTLLKANGDICNTTGAGIGFIRLSLPTSEIIPKGDIRTFALYFDSNGASSQSNDSLRFDLPVDPIVSSYLNVANGSNNSSLAPTSNTLEVDSGSAFMPGDVIVYDAADNGVGADDERMFVTAVNVNTLTVIRGYLSSSITASGAVGNTDDIYRLPGALLWQDDGTAAVTRSQDEYWGAYLVDSLVVSGGTIVY